MPALNGISLCGCLFSQCLRKSLKVNDERTGSSQTFNFQNEKVESVITFIVAVKLRLNS